MTHTLRSLLLSLSHFSLIVLLVACVQVGSRPLGDPAPMAAFNSTKPQVSLLLASKEAENPTVRLTLRAIEISDGRQWVSLMRQPATITSLQAAPGFLLDRAQVPAGQYGRIRYTIAKAVLEQEGRETLLRVPPEPVEYPLAQAIDLHEGVSLSLLLNWDVAASLAHAPDFSVTIGAGMQKIPLTTGLAFVSCPEIDTVYIIRTDQNRICGSWGVSGRPTYLHAVKERNLLYVLAADQGSIMVLELSSGRIKDRIRIPMVIRPWFMAIDPGGESAYLLDQATDGVYRVDLATGSLSAQARVGERPDYIAFLADRRQVAVSLGRSQKVLLLDPLTLQIRHSLPVGSNPQGVLSHNRDLYVAEGRANMVSLHNPDSGASKRQSVGLAPSRLLAHERTIFVANSGAGSIGVLLPEQLTVLKEVRVGGAPAEMAISAEQSWLYASDSRGEGVVVLDLNSHRLTTRIELKARPLDLEVIL